MADNEDALVLAWFKRERENFFAARPTATMEAFFQHFVMLVETNPAFRDLVIASGLRRMRQRVEPFHMTSQ
jgi:hypothetical protein